MYVLRLIFVLFLESIASRKFIINVTENDLYVSSTLNVFDIFELKGLNRSILSSIEILKYDSRSSMSNLEIDKHSGNIIVKSVFDREEVCPNRRTDDCEIGYMISYGITMKDFFLFIKDANDNSPNFSEKSKEIRILEGETYGKTKFDLPKAVDADTDLNGIERYTIRMNENNKSKRDFDEYFKLVEERDKDNSILPFLKMIKVLDREKVDRFSFTLVAWDRQKRSGECKVLIIVLDINDNAPVWSKFGTSSTFELKECSTNREVLKLEATDNDDPETENGRITYELSEKSKNNERIGNLFHVISNVLYVDLPKLRNINIFDFEIEIVAKDGGGKSSIRTITVKVIDCNNNKPVIEINQRNLKIPENSTRALKLTTVIVKDQDRGFNGEFSCKVDDAEKFQLIMRRNIKHNSGTSIIYDLNTVNGVEFDRERRSAVSVIISCVDRGVPTFSSSQILTVNIEDINDNSPSFSRSSYTFTKEENIPLGSTIGTVVATDLDINNNGRISYEIISNHKDKFSINNRGEIQNIIELDREKTETYQFTVVAKDHGTPPMSSNCTVNIIVQDVNDCTPQVEKQIFFDIDESFGMHSIHKMLGKINVTDADSGSNGLITFRVSQKYSNRERDKLIQVTTDGQIVIYGTVDREVTKSLQYYIIVSDSGSPSLSATTTVIINVHDINDNPPKFIFHENQNSYFANISLESTDGAIVATVVARDADNGANGTVSYKLLNSGIVSTMFSIASDNGQIILQKRLPEKSRYPEKLSIQASDGGTPPLTTIANLYLRYYSSTKSLVKKENSDKNSGIKGKPDKNHDKEPVNVTILYGLAGILFIVFTAVLLLLIFVFLKSRRNANQDYSSEKNLRIRKGQQHNVYLKSNESKCHDDLLQTANMCELIATGTTPKENYTNLMWMNEPHYNFLYPSALQADIEYTKPNNVSTMNYTNYKRQPNTPDRNNTMHVVVNNLNRESSKSIDFVQFSNSRLMSKDSSNSLENANYHSSTTCKPEKSVNQSEGNHESQESITTISGYKKSFVTSTFV